MSDHRQVLPDWASTSSDYTFSISAAADSGTSAPQYSPVYNFGSIQAGFQLTAQLSSGIPSLTSDQVIITLTPEGSIDAANWYPFTESLTWDYYRGLDRGGTCWLYPAPAHYFRMSAVTTNTSSALYEDSLLTSVITASDMLPWGDLQAGLASAAVPAGSGGFGASTYGPVFDYGTPVTADILMSWQWTGALVNTFNTPGITIQGSLDSITWYDTALSLSGVGDGFPSAAGSLLAVQVPGSIVARYFRGKARQQDASASLVVSSQFAVRPSFIPNTGITG